MFNLISGERVPDPRYRGMNPAFVKSVWRKRREQDEFDRVERGKNAAIELENARQQAHIEAANRTKQIEEEARRRAATANLNTILDSYKVVNIARKSAESIIRNGCLDSGFTPEDVKGHRRQRELVTLRHTLMARVYVECPHLSLPQIGRAFGGFDHTTVIFAARKMGVWHNRLGIAA